MAGDALARPPTVAAVEAKLQKLLRRAREIKKAQTIEPPVQVSEIINDIIKLGDGIFHEQTASQRHTALEIAARNVYNTIVQGTGIDDPAFVQVWDLLDILTICGDQSLCEPILPFYLIEELLESQTTDKCPIVFDYLESRRERLMRREVQKTQLAVLRACSELLRRLSRAEDAVFCGRVFFFLFQSFPLGDKSSVNLRGEFHVDNVTTFEKGLDDMSEAEGPAEAMEIDATSAAKSLQAETPNAESDATIDNKQSTSEPQSAHEAAPQEENSKLYPIFWRLQQDFSVPTRLFEDEHFTIFKSGLESTMTKFEKTPTVVQTKAAGDEMRGTKRKLGEDGKQQYNSNYNPKYLTSRDLFELELSDLAFQRHILVQALILIDFLLSLTERSKRKIAEANITKVNASLIYHYTLSEENKDWAISTRSKIANYLQQGPDGNFYYRMVNTVLSRDKNWVRWKLENCPSIVSDAVGPTEFLQAQTNARQATANRRMRVKPMGAIDLNFLSQADASDGLEKLKDRARFVAPTIDDLAKGILSDELDLEMAMTEEEKSSLEASKESKTWRALRTASRTCFAKLDKMETGKSLLDVFAQEEAQELLDDKESENVPAADGKAPDVQAAAAAAAAAA